MPTELTNLYTHTRELLNAVRGSSIKIGENLFIIKQNLPEGTDWGDLLRDEFDISESFASKLISIHKVLVVEGGISQAKLETIDSEKLYLSLKLEGTAEEKVSKAITLTRSDLRREHQDDLPHPFDPKEICRECGATRENHG